MSKRVGGRGPAATPDLRSALLPYTGGATGLLRASKTGSTTTANFAPMSLRAAAEIEQRIDHGEVAVDDIGWGDVSQRLSSALAAWDGQTEDTGLRVVDFDVVLCAQDCWHPPALMLSSTAIAELATALDQEVDRDAQARWRTMPWRIFFPDDLIRLGPWLEPRTGFERHLLNRLSAIWTPWLHAHAPWLRALGSATVLQLADRSAARERA